MGLVRVLGKLGYGGYLNVVDGVGVFYDGRLFDRVQFGLRVGECLSLACLKNDVDVVVQLSSVIEALQGWRLGDVVDTVNDMYGVLTSVDYGTQYVELFSVTLSAHFAVISIDDVGK